MTVETIITHRVHNKNKDTTGV